MVTFSNSTSRRFVIKKYMHILSSKTFSHTILEKGQDRPPPSSLFVKTEFYDVKNECWRLKLEKKLFNIEEAIFDFHQWA